MQTVVIGKSLINRRSHKDAPGPSPFYQIFADGDDIGEVYYDGDTNSAETYVTRSAYHYDSEIRQAIKDRFGTNAIDIVWID